MTDMPAAEYLPERIAGLRTLAHNLRWSWSRETRDVFRRVDPVLWRLTRHNPLELLRRVDPARLVAAAANPEFLERYDAVMTGAAREAADTDTWYRHAAAAAAPGPIAYFCAEFGLHNSVPIYSGGLGILAGDHCKAASDLGVPLVAVGLFYTRGYFDQRLTLEGWQENVDETFDRSLTPLEPVRDARGSRCTVSIRAAGRDIRVAAWRMMVGRVPAFLLDTDLEPNDPADRELTHRLYLGPTELRLRQEWVLGVGGVRLLRALDIAPAAWHANEGHAAFMQLERLRELTSAGVPVAEAIARVRAATVFTTHTPVPAGHDAFTPQQIDGCIGAAWEEIGIDRETFFSLGHAPTRDHGQFHMPVLAIRLSRYVNGVSLRHGEESRRIWGDLWPERDLPQVPIGHITNGVHQNTWMSHHIADVLNQHLGPEWARHAEEPAWWDRVLDLDPAVVWGVHTALKRSLLHYIRENTRRRWADQWKEALHLVGAGTLLDEKALTIGFARRFATYKRADLVLLDLDRLHRLLVDPWRPVQLVFAGKAHPADEPGKRVLKNVYAMTREARFEGRVAFVEDYEMHLAHRLVQGVDLWLNVPRAPLEACGTSGMKAALNFVPQVSTLDGWWCEGYDGHNGWAIPAGPDGPAGDAADADRLFRILEEDVVPLFYHRDARNIPLGWVEKMRHALRVAGSRFTARRMVQDYVRQYYLPAIAGSLEGDQPPTR